MKLGLQIVFGVMSLIPLYFGALNMIYGAARFLPADQVTPALDSQLRFQSAYYLGLAAVIWWVIPSIERHTALIRILLGAIFLGGLARGYSYITVGAPAPAMVGGMVLEIALPLLLIWQAKLKT